MQIQESRSNQLYRQYKRLKKRLTRWGFQQLSSRKKAQLQRRLIRCEQQLYRLAGATALVALGATNLQAQVYCEQTGSNNPFNGINVGVGVGTNRYSSPQLIDLDGDGDVDLVIGERYGTIFYYQNDGSSNYIHQTGSNNPFDGIDVGFNSAPQLVDVDRDGDLDLISGEVNGTIVYYQNNGSNNFVQQVGSNNPFNGIDVGFRSSPQLVDVDRDGDLDLISGNNLGTIAYYRNSGSNNFVQQTGSNNPFDGIDVGVNAKPQLVDVDVDGDLDLICGRGRGNLLYYQNDGSNNFNLQTGSNNPFIRLDFIAYFAPQLADADRDGDLDLIAGNTKGSLQYFINLPTCFPSSVNNYVDCIDDAFETVDVEDYPNPQLVNVDGDGDLDLIVGVENGTIAYFQNDDSNNFIQQTASSNPFDGIDVGSYAIPQLVNVDGDGDLDLVVGVENGTIAYFQNDGSNNFTQQTASNNPFDGIDVGYHSSPQLVNVDGDGDLDLIVGEYYGTIQYYQNDGSNNFIQQTASNNPFDGIDVGDYSSPQLVNVDGDSDLDLIIGEVDGTILYYQNDGSNNFIQQTGSNNPFENIDVTSFASPQLIDVDGDSDLDLIVGEDDGFIFFFQNTNLSVSASTTNCTNNQGEVELTISSTDTDGPYTISKSFTGSIGAQGTLGATSTLTTGITFPGAYGFEVSIEPYGCKVAAAVATIDGDCVVPTTRLVDAKTYTGTQILEICTADTIISSATVNSAVNLTYTASQIVILKAGFEAQNGSTFRARIGNCSTPPFTDNEIEARTESVQLDDLIDEHTLLSVFPIPASTHLYYKIEQLADVEAIYLFDMLGRLVREERDLDGEIDIADLPNGQYALVLVGEERQVHRLVQKL